MFCRVAHNVLNKAGRNGVLSARSRPNHSRNWSATMATKSIPELSLKDISRFWGKVDARNPNGCWPWTGARNKSGYGVISLGYKQFLAHRVSLAIVGRDAGELLACHSCDTPLCVNPAHLWAGTQRDNLADCSAKGRRAVGKKHGSRTHPESRPRGMAIKSAKLTELAVQNIRSDNRPQPQIAAQYGVSQTLISQIKLRKIWAHIV